METIKSIKEKAKAYDRAVEQMRSLRDKLLNDGIIKEDGVVNSDFQRIFPELKESEDEMLRKMLIKFIKGSHSATFPWGGFEREQILAWLEKQGEQTCKDEHKHAWSENDEIALGDALWCCKQAASIAKDENDMGNAWYAENWLKSLKDRVLPRQQEWSEEDEKMIGNIRRIIEQDAFSNYAVDVDGDFCEKAYIDADNWLKKLKERYTWKPSDEQMADLWNMVCECRPADQQLLQDIYYGLKTLRGE